MDMGGSAQNTLTTCIGLSARSYQMGLIFGPTHESHMTDLEAEAVRALITKARRRGVNIRINPYLQRRIHPAKDLCCLLSLYRSIVAQRPDVVHTHTSKAGILGRWAAKMAGVPKIVHTPHGHVFYGHFNRSASVVFLYLERLTASITNGVIALTQGERDDYLRLKIAPSNRLVTIHSGVDRRRFLPKSSNSGTPFRNLGIADHQLIVGTVGWLLPIKGPMILLEAMSRICHERPDVDLVYVGKGDLRKNLESRVRQQGLSDRIHFMGWRKDVPNIMRHLDIFVLPSLNEGMGRVLVEAMAAGKPIIASDVGGIPDLVTSGYNGLLVRAGDVQALYAAIKRLLGDRALRDELGKRGREFSSHFSLKKMLSKIDALYASL